MPKSFSDNEREVIRQRLIRAGEECWERYGIKRTTVEDLTQLTGISKGSFYLFFENKELFFMEVLEYSQDIIKNRMMEAVMVDKGTQRERFVNSIMKLHSEMKGYKWLLRMMSGDGEYEYLIRKLPKERIKQHIVGDDEDAKQLLALFGISGVCPETLSAVLRGIFLLLLHNEEVGVEQSEKAFRFLLEGLALRIFEGDFYD